MSNEFSDPYPIDKHESPSSSDATSARRYEELLLAATHPKKRAGRRIFKETRHPIYRGVRKRNNDKWVCELREPNKKTRLWLGTYPTPEMAARAHDVAALALRGKSSCLNFADSASRLPVPVSVEAEDIRRAAHEAAELFRPPEIGGEVGETSNINGGDDDDKGSSWSSSVWKQENEGYIDEEAVFDMPGLLANMAEGLLLSPPHYAGDDDLDADIDVSLWNYPF